jgi:hypothetical protein
MTEPALDAAVVHMAVSALAPDAWALEQEVCMGKKVHNVELSVSDLKELQDKAIAQVNELRAQFPEAQRLAKDDRRLSQGKMGADEAVALRGVIDAMELLPAVFASLADEDEGHDPNKLETDLLRDRFDRHAIYSTLATQFEAAAELFSDAALAMGALVKPVTLAAYEIAKPISRRNEGLRDKIAKALDFYSGRAQVAAATRRANALKNAPTDG